MDPTTDTRFALEGFLSGWMIALIGVALIATAWWMARRDTRVADRPWVVWVLFPLRCVAVLILLWMLAAPTLVTSVRTFRTKSVAVLVDRSASMGLLDVTDGSGNVSRWAAARGQGSDGGSLRELDQAVSRLRAAQNQLERISKLHNATLDVEDARRTLAKAAQGIKAGTAAVRSHAQDLPASAAEIKGGLIEAADSLSDSVLETLERKSAEFSRGKTLAALERENWLPDQLTLVSVAVAQLERWTDELAKSGENQMVPSSANVDDSQRSRFEKVQSFLAAAERSWLDDIRKKATVTRYEFGDRVVPLGGSAWEEPTAEKGQEKVLAPATHLGAALQQVAIDNTAQPVEAAILITDGGHNAGRDPRELAPSLAGTILHIVPIGNTKMQRDVILHHTHAPKAVLQKDTVVVDSIVTAYDCEKETLQVELLENGTVLDRQTLNVTSEVFDQRVQLRWNTETLGKHTLAVRVTPVSDERSEENNTAQADIHVMEDTIRVLVADNFPRWETRYLLNLFKRDDRVTFEHLLFEPQLASGRGARADFPRSLEEWSRYRIVILGDMLPAQLTLRQQELLRQYVTEVGGNLIIVAGNQAMPHAYWNQPLGSILPVQAGDRALSGNDPFYLHLADEGSMTIATQIADNPGTSERIWREMSQRLPIYSLSQFSKPKPSTHSLIWASRSKASFDPSDGRTRSFLAWHYVGAGRVVYIAAPVTYQLRYRQGDTFHHRFWGQLLRWAVARDLAEGSHNVRLSTDKSRYEHGDPVELSARLRQLDGRPVQGGVLRVTAVQDGQPVQEIPLQPDRNRPGTYHGVLEQLPLGPVTLQLAGDPIPQLLAEEKHNRPIQTSISIDPSDMLELRHPLCNLALLRELAAASGGMIIPPTGIQAALDQLHLEPEVLENLTKKPLWNRWDLFWIFIGCLSLEWIGRKFVGLQ